MPNTARRLPNAGRKKQERDEALQAIDHPALEARAEALYAQADALGDLIMATAATSLAGVLAQLELFRSWVAPDEEQMFERIVTGVRQVMEASQ